MSLKWKKWKQRNIKISELAILTYGIGNIAVKEGEINISKAIVEYLPEEILFSTLKSENLNKFTGITIKCKTLDGFDTYFRCIVEKNEFQKLINAIALASKETNVRTLGPAPSFTQEQITQHEQSKKGLYGSIFRRSTSIASALTKYDGKTKRERTINKRGALKWLPILYDNDMVHGSWWFVIGSIGFIITAVVTLINSYDSYDVLGINYIL